MALNANRYSLCEIGHYCENLDRARSIGGWAWTLAAERLHGEAVLGCKSATLVKAIEK
jgi:hypothetical protein